MTEQERVVFKALVDALQNRAGFACDNFCKPTWGEKHTGSCEVARAVLVEALKILNHHAAVQPTAPCGK
jgi:hypothetical protein